LDQNTGFARRFLKDFNLKDSMWQYIGLGFESGLLRRIENTVNFSKKTHSWAYHVNTDKFAYQVIYKTFKTFNSIILEPGDSEVS